jgi:hypothetical protein
MISWAWYFTTFQQRPHASKDACALRCWLKHAAEVCGLMQHVGRSVAATSSTEVRTAEQAEKVIQCGHIVSRLNRIIAAVFSTYITLKRSRTGREYSMLYTRARVRTGQRRVDRHAQTHNTPRLLKLIV